MILTGPEILYQIEHGRIKIEPFDRQWVGPNSVDLHLGPTLRTYVAPTLGSPLDSRQDNPTTEIRIPSEGVVLVPGQLYLGSTVEKAGSDCFAPCLEGRSSIARLGVWVHQSAGFGDHGFTSNWTLEIVVVHPVRLYAGLRIAQVFFTCLQGPLDPYRGKYSDQGPSPTASRLWQDRDVEQPMLPFEDEPSVP